METTNSNREDEGKDNRNVTAEGRKPLRGKSCKGCLFYSSVLNSKSQSPFCVGLSRTLQQVPGYVVSSDSKVLKRNQTLTDFRYTCVGYSVHLEKNSHSAEPEKQLVELPFCVGIEIFSVKRTSNPEHLPPHLNKGKVHEDGHTSRPQAQRRQPRQPMQVPLKGFVHRFARNAGVVAMGVKKNLLRVGNHLKEKMDNALDTYRRRTK